MEIQILLKMRRIDCTCSSGHALRNCFENGVQELQTFKFGTMHYCFWNRAKCDGLAFLFCSYWTGDRAEPIFVIIEYFFGNYIKIARMLMNRAAFGDLGIKS